MSHVTRSCAHCSRPTVGLDAPHFRSGACDHVRPCGLCSFLLVSRVVTVPHILIFSRDLPSRRAAAQCTSHKRTGGEGVKNCRSFKSRNRAVSARRGRRTTWSIPAPAWRGLRASLPHASAKQHRPLSWHHAEAAAGSSPVAAGSARRAWRVRARRPRRSKEAVPPRRRLAACGWG